jgi:hypothetical protein
MAGNRHSVEKIDGQLSLHLRHPILRQSLRSTLPNTMPEWHQRLQPTRTNRYEFDSRQ